MRKPYFRRLAVALSGLLIGLALITSGCGDNNQESEGGNGGPLTIVASTTIVEDLVHQVGGQRIKLSSIVPWNADPHTFALTPSDIRKASEADLLVLVGARLSSLEEDIAQFAEGDVLHLTDNMDLQPFSSALTHAEDEYHREEHAEDEHHREEHAEDEHHREEHAEDEHHHEEHGSLDPHFWMDIDLTIEAVESIRDKLSLLDPDGANIYQERAALFIAELREVDLEIQEMLSALPKERRYLVTFHNAFGYFANRYGLEVLGFVVHGPEDQPSATTIAELVENIDNLGITLIFKEPQLSSHVIEQIAQDTGTSIRTLPSGGLNEDHSTYVDFLRAIAHAISE